MVFCSVFYFIEVSEMNLAMGEETFLPFLLRDHTLSKGLGEKKNLMKTAKCEMEKATKQIRP